MPEERHPSGPQSDRRRRGLHSGGGHD
ncbi:unnamed protein product [Cuscuta epithymum]|uniref:Uncharacterized protein n=1 Tax=Cuscuta epithymum TaxID=186058 RepID=A0AAV0DM78_9ASTE|nr:unnamed protein product [Cuscuta epithymum]